MAAVSGATMAAIAAATAVTAYTVTESEKAKKKAKEAQKEQALTVKREERKTAEFNKKQVIAKDRMAYRARQKSLAAGAQGRQSTILGGSANAAVPTSSAIGAGGGSKTLLGV